MLASANSRINRRIDLHLNLKPEWAYSDINRETTRSGMRVPPLGTQSLFSPILGFQKLGEVSPKKCLVFDFSSQISSRYPFYFGDKFVRLPHDALE